MQWSNVFLIFQREVRDQLRDRRTLFVIAVLPLLLYPLLGVAMLQVVQFFKEHPTRILFWGSEHLPSAPALVETTKEGARFYGSEVLDSSGKGETIDLVVEKEKFPADDKQTAVIAKELIDSGEFDAVVHVPVDFRERIAAYKKSLQQRQATAGKNEAAMPGPQVYFNAAKDKSKIAYARVSRVLEGWRDQLVKDSLNESQIPLVATRPFELSQQDVAEDHGRQAAVWSKLLPLVVLIWALTGAFYPAIDLCAGEKERGTLETLLSSPAERSEIVWGKLLTVMTFSIATALLNLLSMGVTGTFVVSMFQRAGTLPMNGSLGPPPWEALPWLILGVIPVAALFSALSLAVAAMARSTREGQYYLMPLLLVSMPLMILPVLPAAELDMGTSLIPVTGVMLLLRKLIEGEYLEALKFSFPVIGMTGVCVLLAIRWAIDQFNSEEVMFRESERFDLQSWLLHFVRHRGDTPSLGEAVFGGILILLLRFFASFALAPPTNWNSFVVTTLVVQLALIATPALLMAIMLTKSPSRTLLLRLPYWPTVVGAGLLAIAIHPLATWLGVGVTQLYPPGPELVKMDGMMRDLIHGISPVSLVLLFAVTPAICEELFFRGFLLSGLRHLGHQWGAIAISAMFFGIVHLILQQSITAAIIGMVIGYLAIKTDSLLPCFVFHAVHNSLGVLSPAWRAEASQQGHPLSWLFVNYEGTMLYGPVLVIAGFLGSAAILWWFKSLPYQMTEEEQLQDALDHQQVEGAAAAAAK